jgi:hypothetical protein
MLPEFGYRETMLTNLRHQELLAKSERFRLVEQCKEHAEQPEPTPRFAVRAPRLLVAARRQLSAIAAATRAVAPAKR